MRRGLKHNDLDQRRVSLSGYRQKELPDAKGIETIERLQRVSEHGYAWFSTAAATTLGL